MQFPLLYVSFFVMRLFLGLEIPEKIKSELEEKMKSLKKSSKGWESAHDYHITMLFLGPTNETQFEMLQQRLSTFSFHEFSLETDHVQFFNRRIMYMNIVESVELKKLKTEIDSYFPEWIREKDKAFHPHITLKRWQRYEYDHLTSGLSDIHIPPWSFEAGHLSLFKSERDELGDKYHVIQCSPQFTK